MNIFLTSKCQTSPFIYCTMGLDWKPMNKPKPGREKEYEDIFLELSGQKPENTSFLGKLFGKKTKSSEELLADFFEISIEPYDTLGAPTVGIDSDATEWVKSKFEFREDKSLSLEQFMNDIAGYRVVELLTEHEGIPVYIAPHYEPHVFRAQFLNDCQDIIGKNMLEMAYTSQLAGGAIEFARQLLKVADDYSIANNITYLKEQRTPPDLNENSAKNKAHILFSAAKWLLWWGQRGHGYEADF